MKKLLAIIACVMCVSAVSAETSLYKEMAAEVTKAYAENVITAHFTIGIPLKYKDGDERMTGCKAYALDKHWLMMGTGCLYPGFPYAEIDKDGNVWLQPEGESGEFYSLNPIFYNRKRPHEFFYNDNIMLFSVLSYGTSRLETVAHSRFYDTMEDTPKVKVLAFKDSDAFKDFIEEFYDIDGAFKVNTSRFGMDMPVTREIDSVNLHQKTFKIREGITDTACTSTDPIFVMDYARNSPYWFGVNAGHTTPSSSKSGGKYSKDWHGKTSKTFHYFTREDVNFIKRVIKEKDPDAWKRITKNIQWYY